MCRTLIVATLVLFSVAACDKPPVAGSVDDRSAEGAMVRKAVTDVDAAASAAGGKPASNPAPAK